MQPKYTYLLNLREADYIALKAKADKEGLTLADAIRLAIRIWAKSQA